MAAMEENLGFIVTDVARLMRKRFDMHARALGITGPQWRVLLLIERQPGLKQGGIAEILDVEPITTCRMVDRLEQAGLVERRRDPDDRRAWQLYLTDSATPLIDSLHGYGTLVAEQALGQLTDSEKDVLMRLLRRVRDNLGEDAGLQQRSVSHG